jgi:hypothetical protein
MRGLCYGKTRPVFTGGLNRPGYSGEQILCADHAWGSQRVGQRDDTGLNVEPTGTSATTNAVNGPRDLLAG